MKFQQYYINVLQILKRTKPHINVQFKTKPRYKRDTFMSISLYTESRFDFSPRPNLFPCFHCQHVCLRYVIVTAQIKTTNIKSTLYWFNSPLLWRPGARLSVSPNELRMAVIKFQGNESLARNLWCLFVYSMWKDSVCVLI